MLANERPGVYSSVQVTSAVTGAASGSVVGLAAKTAEIAETRVYSIGTLADAAAQFGADSNIAELTRLLLLNGAYMIKAVPVKAENPDAADYAAAFGLLKDVESIRVLACDSTDSAVHAAMLESISTAAENCKYRVGIVCCGAQTVAGAVDAAEALNSERMVVLAPALDTGSAAYTPGSEAAAFAGIVSAGSDPALPFNGAELNGLPGIFPALSDNDITALVRGGVTPLETVGGSSSVVRGITTRAQTGGAPDKTWRELNTTLIVDDVVTTVKSALRSRFSRSKNNERSRGAIRTQVMIELESKRQREIIEGYGDISVAASADDPGICEVTFDFTVAHGLNQILLTAHISV